MKTLAKNKMLLVVLLALVIVTSCLFVACDKDDVTIVISASKTVLQKGDEVALAVVASNGGEVVLSVDNTNLVTIQNGNLVVIGETSVDTIVTVTATLKSDSSVTTTKTFAVKATAAKPEITLEATATEIYADETVTFLAVSTDRGSVTLSLSTEDAAVARIDNNKVLFVTGQITMDTDVTVIATLDSDNTVTATKVITIKARPQGEVKTISLVSDTYVISVTQPATLTVTVPVGDTQGYTITSNRPDLVSYSTGLKQLIVFSTVTEETEIVVTATLNSDNSVKDQKTFTILPPEEPARISISTLKDRITKGDEPLDVSVNVTGVEDDEAEYVVEVSHPDLVTINDDGKLEVVGDVAFNTTITVTATLVSDSSVTASKRIVVAAPKTQGFIQGDGVVLTTDMLKALGNSSITVNGTLSDIYVDFNAPQNSNTHQYEMVVKMEEGKWTGSWWIKGRQNVLTDTYVKSNETAELDGEVYHVMHKVYVGKDNVAVYNPVLDYVSIPIMWENQHLWNHMGDLVCETFEWDSDEGAFRFIGDKQDMEVLYFLTYLSYSFTPVLADTLDGFYLRVEGDQIVGMYAKTETLYYGADTQEDASAMTYSTIELEFVDVGTTVVPDPEAHTAPEHADLLQSAIDGMKNATSYTFSAAETTTYKPVTDAGEYETDIEVARSANKNAYDKPQTNGSISKNYTSAVGIVGLYGQVTADRILLADTGKYDYGMDENLYHTEFSGYYQRDNGTYDEFEYDNQLKEFVGKRNLVGNVADVLPKFTFSVNVFEFTERKTTETGYAYIFQLKDAAITRDVAMQVSMHSYAEDGAASSTERFTIVVDDQGNLVSITYPYSIMEGTYAGYITTTYTKVNQTTIDPAEFATYIPREQMTWANSYVQYYHPDHSTVSGYVTATGAEVLATIYEDWNSATFPPLAIFAKAFQDNIHGPFFNWREKTDANGNVVYLDYLTLTAATDYHDENAEISNEVYDAIISSIQQDLAEYGFVISPANTSEPHGLFDRSTRYATFINAETGCQIVVENNHTRNFWIQFCKVGEWTLKK